MKFVSKLIFFKILRWKFSGNGNFSKDSIKKAVVIAAPHTSWHDFYIAILARSAANIKSKFVAKKELFFFPINIILKILGGVPVDRYSKHNKVDQIADMFVKKDEFRIALSPEGTRQRVDKLKTGFYYIAKKANVPIIMFTLNFKDREILISEPFYTTNNVESDFNFIESFFDGVEGKVKELSFYKNKSLLTKTQ